MRVGAFFKRKSKKERRQEERRGDVRCVFLKENEKGEVRGGVCF